MAIFNSYVKLPGSITSHIQISLHILHIKNDFTLWMLGSYLVGLLGHWAYLCFLAFKSFNHVSLLSQSSPPAKPSAQAGSTAGSKNIKGVDKRQEETMGNILQQRTYGKDHFPGNKETSNQSSELQLIGYQVTSRDREASDGMGPWKVGQILVLFTCCQMSRISISLRISLMSLLQKLLVIARGVRMDMRN